MFLLLPILLSALSILEYSTTQSFNYSSPSACHALVQLCCIQLSMPEYGWTTQKVFNLMNFIVNGFKAVLFGFYKSVFLVKSKALEMVLLSFLAFYFFSTYTLPIFFGQRSIIRQEVFPLINLGMHTTASAGLYTSRRHAYGFL